MALMIVALASTLASAAVLETPPLDVSDRGTLVCRAVNGSATEHAIRIAGLDAKGALTYDTGRFVLAPGAMFLRGAGPKARTCRFGIDGPGNGIRAAALLFPGHGEAARTIEAVPKGPDLVPRPPDR